MITITRRYWGIKIKNIYFPTTEVDIPTVDAAIIGITQASTCLRGMYPIETLQLDLTKSEEELLSVMKKSTRQQIRQAIKLGQLVHYITTVPSNQEISSFREFYNKFATVKQTYRCSNYNLKTLQLLRDKNNLVISRIVEQQRQGTLCYRVYVYDHNRVTTLYSVSHHLLTEDPIQKRLLSMANRFLKWKDILWLKENGCQIFDNGGLTVNPNIRNYKMEFGGTIVTEYSGYFSSRLVGKALLLMRKLVRRI